MRSAAYTLSREATRTMSLMSLKEGMLRNKKYRRLINSFANNQLFKIPFNKYKEEVMTLHTARTVRTLIKYTVGGSDKLADQIIKANLIDQGQRSRLVEIMMHCHRASNAIADAVKVFKTYALIKYDAQLRSFKTKDERTGALDAILCDMLEYKAEAESLYALCEIVVKDIDAAGFSLKRTIDALSLSTARERRI